jgi:S1-C subfamily serine protease
METSLFNRVQLTLMALATTGLVVLAVVNLRQESQFSQPDDGVWWREAAGGLEAVKVLPNSPGQRAGIQAHDLLTGAQVLPESPAEQAEMQTQDLLAGVKALPESSGQSAGILAKDLLPKVNYIPILQVADLERVLYRTGIYG